MAETLHLPPTVFMARLHEDVVVLDVRADRYECLVDAATWLDIAPDGGLTVPDADIAGQLIEAGFASADPCPPHPPIPVARRELALPLKTRRADRLTAFLSLAAGTAAFRGRALKRLLDDPAPARSVRALHRQELGAITAAARAVAPWVPFEGECLQRAYLLRRLLRSEGYSPLWIFGVRTWPFGAHCWLQVDDLVIGDTLDRVRFYTPIMAA